VLTASTTGIARLVVFGDTGLFPIFGFAQVLPSAPTAAASTTSTPQAAR
jgi:hypothetical protein